MNLLDTRTSMMLVAGLYILLPIALLWAIAPHKKHFAWWWLGGSFSIAIGLVLIAGRSLLPIWLTYHVANIALISSFVFWHQSLRVINRKPWPVLTVLGLIALVSVAFSLIYVMFEPIERAAMVRFLLGALSLGLAVKLWQTSKQQKGINIQLIAASFLVTGISFFIHASFSSRGSDPSPFVDSWDANVLALFALLTAVVSHLSFFGLTLDINTQQRLQSRIERIREQETLQLQQQINELERQTDLRMTASQLAHEINQPLTAIMAMSEVCVQALKKSAIPIEKVINNLEKIALNIKRASDLLASIQTESSEELLRQEPFDLEEVINIALELLRPHIELHQVQVRIRLAAHPQQPLGNPLYMTQVITNLARNAIEAMSQCPTKTITIATKVWGDSLELSIEDTGPVLSEEEFNQVSQPYNSTKAQGLGIGLLICRSLLARQGYNLTLYAKPSGGLIATVHLSVQNSVCTT